MTTKDKSKRLTKASDRDEYRTPKLRHFGQVGALTQNGSMAGQENFMMGQIVTMMMS